MKWFRLLFLVPVALASGLAASADAQEAAPENPVKLPVTVVNARKRAEAAIDVPQSVSVIGASEIRDAGMSDIRDAAALVPNLNLVEFSSRRLSFPFVRGVGSGQGDPAVATYVDGVPRLSVGSTNLPLLNVERIEFLRGPQGTLYGRNALGGVIHVITRKPGPAPAFQVGGTAGSHDRFELRLGGETPVVSRRLYVGAAALIRRSDGFTKNDFTGNRVDERDTLFGQGQVLWTPDEDHEIRLSMLGERTRDGGFVLSDLEGLERRPHRISQDFEGVTERDVFSPSLTWRWSSEDLDLVSISSLENLDVLETSDFDFSALDGVRRRTEESLDAFLQEVRVSSPSDAPLVLGTDAELDWLVGALFFTSDSDRSAANEFRPAGAALLGTLPGTDLGRGRFDDRGIGVFGHATLTLFDRLDVGVGLRYDYESQDADLRRSFTSGGVELSSVARDLDEDYDEFLPRFEVAYRPSDDLTVYALAARSFKAGGFNLDAPEGLIPFEPETSWTFEVGVKAALLDGRLRLDAALYHIDWDDMQLSRFDAMTGGYVTNAGESRSRGFELELTARPLDGLDLFASFGLTDAEFESFTDQYGADVGGNDLPFAPETTFGVGAQFTGELCGDIRWFLRAEYVRVGSFAYDAGNRERERYGLASFRVGAGGEHWRLDAWVRNAFDTEYVPVAFQPNPADPTAFVGESGAPRTWGFTFRLDF